MEDVEKGLWVGVFIGIVAMVVVSLVIYKEVMKERIRIGSMEYRDKIYKIVLYDTLERPPKLKKEQ